MVEPLVPRGCIVDTSKKPELILEGSRFKPIESLEQIKGFLDMFRMDTLLLTKKIKSGTQYVSTYEVRPFNNSRG